MTVRQEHATHTRKARTCVTTTSRASVRTFALAMACSLPGMALSGTLPDDDYATLARAAIDQVVLPACVVHREAIAR